MTTALRPSPYFPPRAATPPHARSAARRDARDPVRAIARRGVTLIAVAIVAVVVALLDGLLTPGSGGLPLSVVAFAGFGAAAVSMGLRRAGVHDQAPSPRRRATDATAPAAPAAARRRPRAGRAPWPRMILGTAAILAVAATLLALVVRAPFSAPLLVGTAVTAMLGLRLIAAPPRGALYAGHPMPAVPTPATVAATTHAERSPAAPAAPRWTDDEVHDAALDSFPASDPPSWSPLRVGGPAVPEHGFAA